jgi:hypothetical protein
VDCTQAAIAGPAAGTHRVLVRHNAFDGDPHFAAATRGPGGTWTSATGVVGVSLPSCSGFVVTGNTFRNLGAAVRQGAGTRHVLGPNTLHCDPAATGFSTANRGMGTVEPGGAGWLHVIETCDPADAAYGRMRSATLSRAAAQPAEGTYVAGHFVANAAPATHAGQTLTGWLRLTTGGGHVPGTDWAAIHAGDGSAPADLGFAKVTAFTADGTWTRDAQATHVEVEVWGAGGGGGAGAVAAPGVASSGGGGGGGGGKRRARYRAVDLPASVAVTVGAPGAAGTVQGAGGAQGGTSGFGDLLRAWGGGGGAAGGTATAGGGGGAGDNNPGNNAIGSIGGAGGGAFGAAGGGSGVGGSERLGGAGGGGAPLGGKGQTGGYAGDAGGGGGGGGGISAGGVQGLGGNTIPFNAPGVLSGGTAPGGAGAPVPDFAYGTPASIGGPGGAAASSGPGGAGAVGQTPAGGGGGGGAASTGQPPGPGAPGGAGLVLVYEW